MPRRRGSVYVTQEYAVYRGQEPAVVVGLREWDRITERLDRCRRGGWGNLWLAGVGVGAALAAGAFVGALTLPITSSGIKDVLWAVTVIGVAVLVLCLAAYLTQRHEHGAEIGELLKDLENIRDKATPN